MFSRSVMSNSLQLHGVQHARLLCPSPSPEACSTHVHWVSDTIQWSHPLLSPSPPAFNLSQHRGFSLTIWRFTSGSQSTGASASASVLPVNIQDCFPLGLTGLIPLLSKGLSKVFPNTTVQKHQFFSTQPSCFPCDSVGKESTCNVGDLGSIPGLGRSPGEGKGYPLQYSDLENSMDLQRVKHDRRNLACTHALTSVHDYWKNSSFD